MEKCVRDFIGGESRQAHVQPIGGGRLPRPQVQKKKEATRKNPSDHIGAPTTTVIAKEKTVAPEKFRQKEWELKGCRQVIPEATWRKAREGSSLCEWGKRGSMVICAGKKVQALLERKKVPTRNLFGRQSRQSRSTTCF